MSIINFKVEDKGKVISVSYDASITIKDFILDYLAKHCKNESQDLNQYSFYVGSNYLTRKILLDKQLKVVIKTNSIVRLRRQSVMSGGGCGGI
jgi:hypothetical protein